MRCWCCDREIRLARKVKLRPWREFVPQGEMQADDPAYAFYEKEMTYRWAVICQGCYGHLDNEVGVAANRPAAIQPRRCFPRRSSVARAATLASVRA